VKFWERRLPAGRSAGSLPARTNAAWQAADRPASCRRSSVSWWRELAVAPPTLGPPQRLTVLILTIVTALSRWLALARTPWDWDEMLFQLALRRYDVAAHHPHPPGFPLFIAMAKCFRIFGFSDFHKLQAVSVTGAVLVFPAMFFLCRELRVSFRTSVIASLLLAFFPNVWFFGGSAFSDVPSLVLALFAVAALLGGCHSARLFYLGALILGIAAGFRPQSLIIAFVPMLVAISHQWRQRAFARIVAALAITAAIVIASYGAAAQLTGPDRYVYAVKWHQAYITKVDSFRAPGRTPLYRLIDDFFVRPYEQPFINGIITLLVIGGLVRLRPPAAMALAAFGPFCIFAWLILDHFSSSRFSIGYAPLFALLAAEGLSAMTRRWPRVEEALAVAILGLMTVWARPALNRVRREISPTVQAADWIRNHVDPKNAIIYVDQGMHPVGEYFLPEYRLHYDLGESSLAAKTMLPAYYLREGASTASDAHNFFWPHDRLWKIARRRYFETTVLPLTERFEFGEGWYGEEGSDGHLWRWMARRSVTRLPQFGGRARLAIDFNVPLQSLPAPPHVTVALNGAVVDRFTATEPELERSYLVDSRSERPNELVIETDRTFRPSPTGDTRELGLEVVGIRWMPVR